MPAELPRIVGVRTRTVIVPLDPAVETSAGDVTAAPLVLIDLETSDGCVGRSYLFCYTTAALAPVCSLVSAMGSSVVGQQLAPLALHRQLVIRARLLGAEGLVGMAIGGLDMALWDAHARVHALSLCGILGAEPLDIGAYLSLRSANPERIADEACSAVAAGYRAVKIRLGHPDESVDLARVHAAQSALDAVERPTHLMVDYNQALAPMGVADAARRIRRLEAAVGPALAWVEDPLASTDDRGHAELTRAVSVPIQLGESWAGSPAVAGALATGAGDLAMLDVARIGGVSGWMQAAALAVAAGRPLSSHLYGEFSLHLLAVAGGAHWLEMLDLANPILQPAITIVDGKARGGNTVGSGITWNEAAIQEYAVR